MIERIKNYAVTSAAAVVGVAASVAPSFAVDMTITDLFTAANISTVNTNVGTLLLGFIGINLLFLGYRYLRRTGVR